MSPETTVQTLSDIRPGSILAGRYEIRKHLGAGGFATVFAGFDPQIARDVAIKVLDLAAMASGRDPDLKPFLERFRREAQLAARIRHPNVVEIYDFGVLGDQVSPFIVMELLDGHDMQDELDERGGMPPTRALPLFCSALDALGEAHRLGIVHKDLKPANLFLNRPATRQEILKLVDFGIAHIGESTQDRMTQTGAVFGTPQYLPPEYLKSQIVTPAMDVYQMGLILVEILTGRNLIDADTLFQCVLKHVNREFSLPEELLDGPLGPVLRRALEFEHTERYPNASAFADALSRIDPSHIGDVRAPDTRYRKIDNTSGQFVPDASMSARFGQMDTAEMLTASGDPSDTLATHPKAVPAPRAQPHPAQAAATPDARSTISTPQVRRKSRAPAVLVLMLLATTVAALLTWYLWPTPPVDPIDLSTPITTTDSAGGANALAPTPADAPAQADPAPHADVAAQAQPAAQPNAQPEPAAAANAAAQPAEETAPADAPHPAERATSNATRRQAPSGKDAVRTPPVKSTDAASPKPASPQAEPAQDIAAQRTPAAEPPTARPDKAASPPKKSDNTLLMAPDLEPAGGLMLAD